MDENQLLKDLEIDLNKQFSSFEQQINKIRGERASSSMIENEKVKIEGESKLLKHIAHIEVSDSKTLSVRPFQKENSKYIIETLVKSNLGDIRSSGQDIKLILHSTTQEKNESKNKILSQAVENSKISIKNIRKKYFDLTEKITKSEDIQKSIEKKIQNKIDDLTKKIEQISKNIK